VAKIDRRLLAERGGGRKDDQGGKMDTGTKKHRTSYFQDGDPPLEYEEWSDSDSDEPESESESDGDEEEDKEEDEDEEDEDSH
jgi:hypothetical protein